MRHIIFRRDFYYLYLATGIDLFNLMPQKHTTNNALSFYKDPDSAKKYALPERWSFLAVGTDGYFQIKNERTGLCLVSNG